MGRSVDGDQLAVEHISGVVVFIGAGGEHDDPVLNAHLHIAGKIGKALHFFQIGGVFRVAGKVPGVGTGIGGGDKAAEHFNAVVLGGGVQVQNRVGVVVFLLAVILAT